VSCMHVNNETGVVQPLREIAEVIRSAKSTRTKDGLPIYLHSDAAQAPCYQTLSVHSLGVDLMSINAGKIYGPKQSGCLYVSARVELARYICGGGQERGLRSGTENVASVVGCAAALKMAAELRVSETGRVGELRKELKAQCELIGGAVIGDDKSSSPHILSIIFDGCDNERVLMDLDIKGFQIAASSACHASSTEVSRVLRAYGLSDATAKSTLRLSLGRSTTADSIRQLVSALKESAKPL
jgi:cysteine desulfurase